MLIGAPASGKSTWRDMKQMDEPSIRILSSDDLIEFFAEQNSITYDEAFGIYAKDAMKTLNTEATTIAEANDASVIWDQTNMSIKSRKFKLEKFKDFHKVAVVFEQSLDVLVQRCWEREKEIGKHIPIFVIKNMLKSFEKPTLDEFDEVINVV